MQTVRLGTSDLVVPRVCLGTMTFGEQVDERDSFAILDRALERGVNFIDTAEMYSVPPNAESYGKTETMIGRWLRRQPRDRVVLATKIAGPGRAMTWIRGGDAGFDRANLRRALEDSLRRLQTDYVDLYQIHWPDRYVPMFGATRYDAAQERDSTPIVEQLQALGTTSNAITIASTLRAYLRYRATCGDAVQPLLAVLRDKAVTDFRNQFVSDFFELAEICIIDAAQR